MHTRRQFLSGSAAAAAAMTFSKAARAVSAPESAYGVQLYTVRSVLGDKPAAVLAQIHRMGYRCVETYAAEYKVDAKTLRSMIADAGLALPSAHFGYDDMDKYFDYCKELGAKFMVVGSASPKVADSAEGFKRAAQQFNRWGEKAQTLGLEFGFHSHNTEFQPFGDVRGIDILMKETDPKLVKWQPDVYWIAQAGVDPVTIIHKYGNRVQSLHFKDRKPNVPTSYVTDKDSQHFTEAGTGTLDFRAIWNAASALGVRYFFVEQDTTDLPPLESLQVSYTNLHRMLS